jgi:FkbM family methyltransferase
MALKETAANFPSVRTGTDNFPDNRSVKAATERTGGVLKIKSVELPVLGKSRLLYDNEIYPRLNHIRGTTQLKELIDYIGISSIVSETASGYRLDALSEPVYFSEKSDAKYVFMEYKHLQKFLEVTSEAKVFCDVGAYHGFYSLVSNAEQNYCFEVDPDNIDKLEKNLELNQSQDVTLEKKAVWSSNDSVRIETGKGGESHVSNKVIERESVKLDSFFQDREDPDVVKIDVEGAEGHVLEGAEELLSRSKPILFIEFHFDGRMESFENTFEELKDFLEDIGYSFSFVENRRDEKLVVAR